MIKFKLSVENLSNRGSIEIHTKVRADRNAGHHLLTSDSDCKEFNNMSPNRLLVLPAQDYDSHRLRMNNTVNGRLIYRALNTGVIAALIIVLMMMSALPAMSKELTGNVREDLTEELGFPLYVHGPDSKAPKAVVVAIHGATLHGRAFDTLSKELSKHDYMVIAGDMRGFGDWIHGKARGPFPHHVLYKWSEADLRRLLSKLRELYPEKPIYLVGESVGANMAVRLLAGDPYCAEGAILSSPAVHQRMFIDTTVVKQFLTVMVNPKAQLSVEPFIRKRISEKPEITLERLNDPLGRNKMNVGELFKTRWFNKESIARAPFYPSSVPILVMEGSEDKLFHPEDVNKLMADLPAKDKELLWLKGKGHINLETKFLDPEVVNLVVGWLDKKTAITASLTGSSTTTSAPAAESAPAAQSSHESHLQAKVN